MPPMRDPLKPYVLIGRWGPEGLRTGFYSNSQILKLRPAKAGKVLCPSAECLKLNFNQDISLMVA